MTIVVSQPETWDGRVSDEWTEDGGVVVSDFTGNHTDELIAIGTWERRKRRGRRRGRGRRGRRGGRRDGTEVLSEVEVFSG